ncbi:hypothetical protein [Helicobacter labacensis]|uniref:hypothetical protein n=1 Tax=Helicobacter labacensis TaxID=2316079 RepID=UPI000EB2D1A2|nr:hypothetical protein [Helicobacter labacensis]
MDDFDSELEKGQIRATERRSVKIFERALWMLPLVAGRALFSYLPLAVSYIFKDSAGHNFQVSLFLSLGFVFIAQINDLPSICKQGNFAKARGRWISLFYALRVFLGICSLAIYAAKPSLYAGVYMEETREEHVKYAQEIAPREAFKRSF